MAGRLRRAHLVLAGALILLSACGEQTATVTEEAPAEAAPTPERTVMLSPDEAKQLGIETMPVQSFAYSAQAEGYGAVENYESLAQTDSEIATAEAAVRESAAAVRRARELVDIGAVARHEVEAAERQATDDAAQLGLAQRKLTATFGQNAPVKSAAQRTRMLGRLTSGQEVLVHVTFPLGAISGAVPQKLFVAPLDGSVGPFPATPVWDAPADPTIPGRSYFTLASGRAFSAGDRLLVSAPVGVSIAGVLIPADAVVFSEGSAWCYLMTGPETFLRVAVDTGKPVPGGYFVTAGAEAGQMVVIAGNGLLLARENAPAGEE